VKIAQNIILWSGGTTYEISSSTVYVLPKIMKENYGQWNPQIGQYVILTRHGEVVHVPDNMMPSNLGIIVKYTGESVKRFIELAQRILMKYYRGGGVMKLPLSDKNAFRFAVCLARMSQLQGISDVI
jgi:hypothetical protein